MRKHEKRRKERRLQDVGDLWRSTYRKDDGEATNDSVRVKVEIEMCYTLVAEALIAGTESVVYWLDSNCAFRYRCHRVDH